MDNPIKAEHLEKAGASCCEVKGFARVFPAGAKLTKANCLKAAREGFNLNWFARHFLTVQASEVYVKATAQARVTYEKAKAPALWEAICLEEAENVKSSRQ